MTAREAYETLKRLVFVRTHAGFSLDFLLRGHRYFDDVLCSGRALGIAPLATLAFRVRGLRTALAGCEGLERHPG
jgi:hypothetical protein